MGLGFGPMLRIGDHDVYGAEVNAAAKLGEDTAKAHEILVTGAVREAAAEGLPAGVTFERIDTVPPGANEAWRVATRADPLARRGGCGYNSPPCPQIYSSPAGRP